MPTWQVPCAVCGEDRWPVLPARPTRYECVRCRAVPPETRARRVARARQAVRTRRQTAPGTRWDVAGAR